jgi:hypothetical protein
MYSETNPEIVEECSIRALNALLKGEMVAVETYQYAIHHISDTRKNILQGNLLCHDLRIHVLCTRIRAIGGEPIQNSGVWGRFMRIIEGGAALMGNDLLLAILEEGEQHGLLQYQSHLHDLDPLSRRMIVEDVMPAQMRTYKVMVGLRKNVSVSGPEDRHFSL